MQGNFDRDRKSSYPGEKEGRDVVTPKVRNFKEADPIADEFMPYAPHVRGESSAKDDGTVPWANYRMEDPLESNYYSQFLSEFSEEDLFILSGRSNSFGQRTSDSHNIEKQLAGRSNNFGHGTSDSQNTENQLTSDIITGNSDPNGTGTAQLGQLSEQRHSSGPSTESGVRRVRVSSSRNRPSLSEALLSSRLQKQDNSSFKLLQPKNNMGAINFPHLSNPVTLAKDGTHGVSRLSCSGKMSVAKSSNHMESTVVHSTSDLQIDSGIKGPSASVLPTLNTESFATPPQEATLVEQLKATSNKDIISQDSRFTKNMALGRHETGKAPEAIVTSSSACSISSDEAVLSNPKQKGKRKNPEEDLCYQSDDLEDEPLSSKKLAVRRGMDAKKSRAAEVHNLSERRRRDKINEKMRGLQDLIPNCNKADKASVLDEAIEYIKTLQMQLQVMSMQMGIYMPPMMAPAGVQQMHAPAMTHFSPMSLGMGMSAGMGYGMGMYDINGVPRFPIIPFQSMHGSQFSSPSIRAPGIHGMPESTNFQMFAPPVQGIPPSTQYPLPSGSSSELPMNANLGPEASGLAGNPVATADITLPSVSNTQHPQSMNIHTSNMKSTNDPLIQTSIEMSNQALHDPVNEAQNPIAEDGT